MKYLSHDTTEIGGIRFRGVRVGPVMYQSLAGLRAGGPSVARYVFAGRWSIARGPLAGITEGLTSRDSAWVLRIAHPSIVLAHAAQERTA